MACNYADLIGIPFAWGGRGPDSFDCYGLVRHIHAQHGIDIPDYTSPSDGPRIAALIAGNLHLWREVSAPKEGVVLLFRVAGYLHVGYHIGGDRFIHTWEHSGGVVIERVSDWTNRVIGYYEYAGK